MILSVILKRALEKRSGINGYYKRLYHFIKTYITTPNQRRSYRELIVERI